MDRNFQEDSEHQADDRPIRGWIHLSIGVSIAACLWLVVLPRVAQIPRVRGYLERLEQKGIDPSAMFYTELEFMEPIYNRIIEKLQETEQEKARNRKKQETDTKKQETDTQLNAAKSVLSAKS